MKVIDLLNKIANGEIPKKIKFCGKIWEYDDGVNDYSYYLIDHYEYLLSSITFSFINDEVEIIEDTPEDKKIEKLDLIFEDKFIKEQFKSGSIFYLDNYTTLKKIYEKQCEIIDKINGE